MDLWQGPVMQTSFARRGTIPPVVGAERSIREVVPLSPVFCDAVTSHTMIRTKRYSGRTLVGCHCTAIIDTRRIYGTARLCKHLSKEGKISFCGLCSEVNEWGYSVVTCLRWYCNQSHYDSDKAPLWLRIKQLSLYNHYLHGENLWQGLVMQTSFPRRGKSLLR